MRWWSAGLLGMLACSPRPAKVLQPQVMMVPVPTPAAPTDSLSGTLAAAGVALGLPRERQAEEIQRWAETLDRTQLSTDRLRLALLLTLGAPEVRDPERVRTLLHDQSFSSEHGEYELVARMLLEVVETRAETQAKLLELTTTAQRERQRSAVLEEQLEALKQVESAMDAHTNEGLD